MSWAAQVRKLWLVQCAIWCWAIGDRESPDFEHFDLFFGEKLRELRKNHLSYVQRPKIETENTGYMMSLCFCSGLHWVIYAGLDC